VAVAARAAAVEHAIHQTIARLEAALGPDWGGWSWGRLHAVTFQSPLAPAGTPLGRVLGWFLNVGPFPAPGDSFTVNAAYWWDGLPFTEQMAPGYRQVVDLEDLRSSRWTPGPPGQAEQRGSPHYADLAEPWLRGYYRPMLWTRADAEADAESTLTLEPGR
jgi:penicillin amidase